MVHFRKNGDRNISHEVLCMKVNPKMDLVALALDNGDIAIHRLINWQRVWTAPKLKNLKVNEKSEDGKEVVKIADFVWSPDGHILAVSYVGYLDADKSTYPANITANFRPHKTSKSPSSLVLYHIDAGKTVAYYNSDLAVQCLYWQEQELQTPSNLASLPLDTLDIPYLDLFADEDDFYHFLGPLAASKVQNLGMVAASSKTKKLTKVSSYHSKHGNIEDYEKIALLGPSSAPTAVPFNILLTGCQDGYLDLYAFGLYRLFRLDLNRISPSVPTSSVRQLWITTDLATVSALSDSGTLIRFLIPLLSTKWPELLAFVRLKAALDIRLEFLFDCLKEITSIWEDLMAEIDSKLSNYVQRDEESLNSPDKLDSNPFKPRSNKIKLEPNEFIEMLVFGEISLNLERFLTDLTEKNLKKLAGTIEVSFLDIHKANINKVQRALFHILGLLHVLKAMSLHDLQFGDLSLSTRHINTFIRETLAMLSKTMQLQSNLNDSMRKTKAFIRWLHKCTAMVVSSDSAGSALNGDGDASMLGGGGYVLTNQDLNLIMNFLRENSLTNGFKFENIAVFFRKTKAKVMKSGGRKDCGPSGASSSSSKLRKSKRKAINNPKKPTTTEGVVPKEKSGRGKKTTPNSEVTVPYKAYLKHCQLRHFLATLDQLNDGSSTSLDSPTSELLQNFCGRLTASAGSGLRPLDDIKAWEEDLFGEDDDLGQLDEAAWEPYSLYEHLYRLYESFRVVCSEDGECAKRLNEAVCGRVQEEIAEKMDEPAVVDYFCGKSDDFVVVLERRQPECLTMVRIAGRKSGSLVRKRRQLEFYVQRPNRKFIIEDAKFYNEEYLTVVLSDPATLMRLEEEEGATAPEGTFENSRDPNDSAENMSLMSDDEMMSEEDAEGGKLPAGSRDNNSSGNSNSLAATSSQYLVQLPYRSFWETSLREDVISLDLTAEVDCLKPKNVEGDEEGEGMDVDRRPKTPVSHQEESEMSHKSNAPPTSGIVMRYLGEGPPIQLGVSGQRKLACLATNSRTRLAVYEMDVSEDEEDSEQAMEEGEEEVSAPGAVKIEIKSEAED